MTDAVGAASPPPGNGSGNITASDRAQFDAAIHEWLADAPSSWERRWRSVRGWFYGLWPVSRSWLSWARLFLRLLLAISAPLVATIFYKTVSIWPAIGAAAVLLILNLAAAAAEQISAERANPLAVSSFMHRWSDLMLETVPAPEQKIEPAIQAALGIVENFICLITQSPKGSVGASVVLYTDPSLATMKVRYRNTGNDRPRGRDVPSEMFLGHFVCSHPMMAPRIVDDVRRFGAAFRSPTQSKPAYRSILFMPLMLETDQGSVCCGFLSVDCPRPYAFFGNRWGRIVVEIESVVAQVQSLIQRGGECRGLCVARA